MKKSLVTKLLYAVCVAIMLWAVMSTAEVMIHNCDEDYVYSRCNMFALGLRARETKSATVTDCVAEGEYYVVTVSVGKGNEYSYYDDEPKAMGETIVIVFDEDRIVDAR